MSIDRLWVKMWIVYGLAGIFKWNTFSMKSLLTWDYQGIDNFFLNKTSFSYCKLIELLSSLNLKGWAMIISILEFLSFKKKSDLITYHVIPDLSVWTHVIPIRYSVPTQYEFLFGLSMAAFTIFKVFVTVWNNQWPG